MTRLRVVAQGESTAAAVRSEMAELDKGSVLTPARPTAEAIGALIAQSIELWQLHHHCDECQDTGSNSTSMTCSNGGKRVVSFHQAVKENDGPSRTTALLSLFVVTYFSRKPKSKEQLASLAACTRSNQSLVNTMAFFDVAAAVHKRCQVLQTKLGQVCA